MKRTHIIIAVIALLTLVPAINYLAGAKTETFTETHAIQLATDTLMETPTYTYDGIPDSLEQTEATQDDDIWTITFTYTSRHSGYGDREGQVVLQVLTDHTTVIQIRDGIVISATTDNIYNELTQEIKLSNTGANEAQETAINWLKNAPTFSYDGIQESLNINATQTDQVITMPTLDNPLQNTTTYTIIIGFTTRHPGYGDRTGLTLAQGLTPHMAVIKIENKTVTSAIIDQHWDELHQVTTEIRAQLPPTKIHEITVEHLNTNYPEAANLTTTGWTATDKTQTINVEEAVMKYTKNNWTITITSPTPAEPNFQIEAQNTNGFEWSGEFFTDQLLN